MMNMNMIICEFIVSLGFFVFVSSQKRLLSMLLILEVIVLGFFILIFFFNLFNFESYFMMMFLTFSVCEGSLWLPILVSMIRTHENDYFQSFNIL